MVRKTFVIAVMALAIGALLISAAMAGNGPGRGKATQQQVKKSNPGVCPLGNTSQGGKAAGKMKGYGPGDGTGNGGNGPKDGTGYGPGQKSDGTGTGTCDGTGPKGKRGKNTVSKPGTQKNTRATGRRGRNR